jgi:hypothetical protein
LTARQAKQCIYPNVYQYFINLSKNTTKTKIVFWLELTSAHYVKDTLVRLEEIEYVSKEENPPNVPQTADRKFLGELEKEGLQQQLSSNRCKVLIAKIRKELKSIETTRGHEGGASKGPKGPQAGCNFFWK